LLLLGPVGVGKSTIMEIFKKYCNYTQLPHHCFQIADVREVVNNYKREGNIEKYTFNRIKNSYGVDKANVKDYCFDDFGTETENVKHFGSDLNPISELILDRYTVFILFIFNFFKHFFEFLKLFFQSI